MLFLLVMGNRALRGAVQDAGNSKPERAQSWFWFVECKCQYYDYYLLRLIKSPSNSSTVVIIFELAWKPRWTVIILTNSEPISTLDCSSELVKILPSSGPGKPVRAGPELVVAVYRLLPASDNPLVLTNLPNISWAIFVCSPFE